MSLTPEALDAMQAAGLTAEQIVAVVKADMVAEQVRQAAAAAAKAAADEERKARARESNRERQARFRERRNANNADNGVTRRDERYPAPKENNQTPTQTITPVDASASTAPEGADDGFAPQAAQADGEGDQPEAGKPVKPVREQRGKRLPDNFTESEEAHAVCAEMGLRGREISEALAEFCDYWRAVPGAKGRKLDWPATLRNRLREVGRRRPGARASPPAKPRFSNGFFASLDAEVSDPDERYSDPEPCRPRLAAGGRH